MLFVLAVLGVLFALGCAGLGLKKAPSQKSGERQPDQDEDELDAFHNRICG